MRRIIAVLSVMAVMVTVIAMPAFAAPRSLVLSYDITCPDGSDIEIEVEANPRDFAESRKEVNRALAQLTQSRCTVTRSTSPF
jgi:hypothetical protein